MEKGELSSVRAKIIALRADSVKWREIGEMYPGVKLGTLCRIAHDAEYTPKSRSVLKALGLICIYPPHPVVRLTELNRRIDALHFSPEIKREIRSSLLNSAVAALPGVTR
jgi:hypothetical protein